MVFPPTPPSRVTEIGSADFLTSVVVLATDPAEVVPARPGRHSVLLVNLDDTITVYVGNNSDADTQGVTLLGGTPGGSVRINTQAAIWAASESGTPSMSVVEEF